ncbi:C4-dicarboxylate transporter DcuC [uncultured Sutterella sp.]|uniref:C4-dicarboxylate transporter DcuC n=1 Tax=uncultured Sutterella sp. TaxID=286133 RepID=UPI0026314102|nr:C4-dicarboxylate transporter DcuC [uncultured Sutterella sp.]
MLGIFLVVASVILAAYLVIKRYYAPWALLMVGLLLLICVSIISGAPLITGKKATHSAVFDIVQVFTNLLQSRTAGIGMNIICVGGFAYYMDKIGATKALVNICIKPLSYIHAPYVLLGVAYLVGQLLNVFIPSAVGLGMLLMVTIYPLLVAVGVSRLSAAAVVATASCLDLGPASGNSLLAAEISNLHVMEFFIENQLPVGIITAAVIAVGHVVLGKFFDKRDLASGRLTQDDFKLRTEVKKEGAAAQPEAPIYYAILPILPVVLLFVFSKLVYAGIRLEVVTAILSCALVAFVVDLLTVRNLRECTDRTKAMFNGMGKIFSSTVLLIVCAEVFAEGLKRSGGIDTILQSVAQMQGAGGVTMLLAMFLIMTLAAFVTGSGNAAFFAFSPLLPQAAQSVAWSTVTMAVPVQLASGIARSMSPIAGVVMAVSGIAEVSPFELVRRTIPVMVFALLATFLASVVIL